MRQNYYKKSPFVTFLLVVLLLTGVFALFQNTFQTNPAQETSLSEVSRWYKDNVLESVMVKKGKIEVIKKDGTQFFAYRLPQETVSHLGFLDTENDTKVSVEDTVSQAFWGDLFSSVFTIILILFILSFFLKKMGGGVGGMSFGLSKAKLFSKEKTTTKFDDVAGAEESKEELKEVVDFLKYPKKYSKIGAKIPRGILLVGNPGTGKTLLARAVAGEAGVPFFSISGSEFIEMFVGVGASRVRDLFEKAKKVSPSIVFIDEIDAIGKQRGPGFGGGHDEREQTLNQILTEMDGFENETQVIVIAATNRPDVLDKALLRPGRFDRRVHIDMPDSAARAEILLVHAKNKPIAKAVSFENIAKKTSGFSGAELESVMNEAAIATAKANKTEITEDFIFEAVEKVLMGPEKRSRKVIEKEKEVTAYHEVGHALVAKMIPECDPVYKISIVARGFAGGVTWFLPDEEKRLMSKKHFLADICSLLGGRSAEILQFGEENVTTGASHDLERATHLARSLVTKYGMSPLGIAVHDEERGAFMGADITTSKKYSEKTAQMIDEEVSKILSEQLKRAQQILEKNKDLFQKISLLLLEKEVILGEEFASLCS
jgi:cell division protease FtsH